MKFTQSYLWAKRKCTVTGKSFTIHMKWFYFAASALGTLLWTSSYKFCSSINKCKPHEP